MTAVRKIVNSNTLTSLFDLPPDLKNRNVEVLLFPVEEAPKAPKKDLPKFTRAQIEEWAKAVENKGFAGALKGANLPPDITMKDIREQRLAEKYGI